MEFPLLIFGIWFLKVLYSSSNQPKKSKENVQGNLLHDTPSRKHTKNQVKTPIQCSDLELCNVDYVLQTWSLLNLVRCSTFLKIMKHWSRWSSRAEVQQWDTHPEPTELRLIGYVTESTLTHKSKSNMSTPKTKSQTYWPRAISHVMNGIIFSICSISAFFSSPKRCRK